MRHGARGGRRGHRLALPLSALGVVGLTAAAVVYSASTSDVDDAPSTVESTPAPSASAASPAPTPSPSDDVAAPVPPPVDPATLPRPSLEGILPADLPVADGATGLAATPRQALTAGYTAPDGEAVIALEADGLGLQARWAVTDTVEGWVQVLVPFGRGALPSVDPARTNHVAAWVPADAVDISSAAVVTLDLSDRTLAVGERTFPVGVGRDVTPTPTGVCAVAGHVYDPHVGDALLTSCQSLAMDEFYGDTGYAAIALHADTEGGAAVGQARSNGCVRMHAGDFAELLATLPAGSVVEIVA